jgi:D-alanyl-D-alanine carboxypeptidase
MPPALKAPVKDGQKVGEVEIKDNDGYLGKADLVCDKSIDKKQSFFENLFGGLEKLFKSIIS